MSGFFMFLHISSYIFWVGTLISFAIILPKINPIDEVRVSHRFLSQLIHSFNTIGQLAAVVVFFSGVFQSIQLNFPDNIKPFWLQYMELAGGIILCLSVITTAMMEREVKLIFNSSRQFTSEITKIVKRIFLYHTIILFVILIALSIVIVTSFKL